MNFPDEYSLATCQVHANDQAAAMTIDFEANTRSLQSSPRKLHYGCSNASVW